MPAVQIVAGLAGAFFAYWSLIYFGVVFQRFDLVALGSIADMVRLDENNRRLVHAGLRRIRAGQACAGISALFAQAGREPRGASSSDLGFLIGPRINAAGRLADISLGIACLLTDAPEAAAGLAQQLDAINRERQDLERHITPCQFGGNPDCTNCGCIASAGLEAIGRHKIKGVIPVGQIFYASVAIGRAAARDK